MDNNPVYVLVGAIVLLGVLFSLYIFQKGKQQEAAATPRRATDAAASETTGNPPPPAGPPRTATQKLLAIPFFGAWLATILGFVVPVVAVLIAAPDSFHNSRWELAAIAAAVFVWNVAFTRFAKVRITMPLIPIPLSWVAFVFCLIGLWAGFSG